MAQRRTLDMLMTVAARFGGKTVNLIVFLVLARTLSLADLGLYGFVFVTVLIMSTAFDVGVRNSLGYFIGRNPGDTATLTLQAMALWVVFSVTAVAALWLFFRFSVADLEQPRYFVPCALFMASALFLRMLQGALMGQGRIKFYNQTELMSRLVLAIGTFGLLAVDSITLFTALWTLALSQAAAALLLGWGTIESAKGGRLSDRGLVAALLRRGVLFMLGVLLMHASKRLAFMILSQLGTPEEMGVFFGLQRLTEVLTEIGLAVAVVVFSHNVRAKSDGEAVETAAHSTRISFALFTLIALVLFVFADWLVPLALGLDFAGDMTLFRVILVATLAGSIWTILYPSLSAITSPMTAFWIFLPNVVLNCITTWFFYQSFGIMGAAYSLLVVNTTLSFSFLLAFKLLYGAPVMGFLLPRRSDLELPSREKLARFIPMLRRKSAPKGRAE